MLNITCIDSIPYLLQGGPEFLARDGSRVVVSSGKVCKCRDVESPPYIVSGAARREIILDIFVVDSTAQALGSRGTTL